MRARSAWEASRAISTWATCSAWLDDRVSLKASTKSDVKKMPIAGPRPGEEGEHLAHGLLLAAAIGEPPGRLDLVVVAPAGFRLHHEAGYSQVVDDVVGPVGAENAIHAWL